MTIKQEHKSPFSTEINIIDIALILHYKIMIRNQLDLRLVYMINIKLGEEGFFHQMILQVT